MSNAIDVRPDLPPRRRGGQVGEPRLIGVNYSIDQKIMGRIMAHRQFDRPDFIFQKTVVAQMNDA
jgi:hypothetical protein